MLDRLLDRGLGVRCLDVTQELAVLADQGVAHWCSRFSGGVDQGGAMPEQDKNTRAS
jgi:hypothetical protein